MDWFVDSNRALQYPVMQRRAKRVPLAYRFNALLLGMSYALLGIFCGLLGMVVLLLFLVITACVL